MPGLQTTRWEDQIGGMKQWAKWIDQGAMKNNGVSVVLYNQGLDVRVQQGGSHVSEGFCLAMSIMWVIKTARNESFWDWFHPPIQACPNLKDRHQNAGCGEIFLLLRNIMAGEAKRGQISQKLGGDEALLLAAHSWWRPKITNDSAAQRYPAADALVRNAVAGDLICDALLKTKSGYKIFGVIGSGGGHAMACRVVDGTVVFMDPNYGEFYFPSFADFRKFFSSFWKSKYSKGFSAYVLVHGFTDPEVIKYG